MTYLKKKLNQNKLTLSFLLIIVLFLSFGIFTIRGIVTLGHLTKTIYDHPLVVSNASLNAALNIAKMHRSMKDVVLAGSMDERMVEQKEVARSERIVYQQLDIIKTEILGDEGRKLENQTRNLFLNWKPIRQEVIQLLESGNEKAAILITKEKGARHVDKLEEKMLELTSYARRKADTFLEMAEASQARLETITIILTFAGVVLSIIIAAVGSYVVLKAEQQLHNEKNKLQKALDEIKILRGIIPICSHCKQIRDDKGSWKQMEEYIHSRSEAVFSHSICPNCVKKHYPDHCAPHCSDEGDD